MKVPFLFRTTLELVWIGDLRYPTKVSYQEAAGLRNFWTLEHCALGTGALKSGFPQATTAVLENEMITNVRGILSICRYIYIYIQSICNLLGYNFRLKANIRLNAIRAENHTEDKFGQI